MINVLKSALKGYIIGAANVIPGVSGGTMAYILGIYERLLKALKSISMGTLKILLRRDWKTFLEQTDFVFLISLFTGVSLSFLSLARVLKWGVENHPILVWSIFFGLILASIPSLFRGVKSWNFGTVFAVLVGLVSASSMAFLTPATENSSVLYLICCGVVAMSSMIIPGLSGSFVLLLMGNYKLIMLDAVSALSKGDFQASLVILIPVGIGAVLGLLILTRLLNWLFDAYRDLTLALIGGFVSGSLVIIWPWKETVLETFVKASGEEKEKIAGFQNWRLPDLSDATDFMAVRYCVLGILVLVMIERIAKGKKRS